jgi:hypothetical protein
MKCLVSNNIKVTKVIILNDLAVRENFGMTLLHTYSFRSVGIDAYSSMRNLF